MAVAGLFGALCIRADASAGIGAGHLMRCLALAQHWRDGGGTVRLATTTSASSLLARYSLEGCEIRRLDVTPGSTDDIAQTREAAIDADWLVLDGYSFDAGFVRACRDERRRLLMVDDLARTDLEPADLVLNSNWHATPALYGGQTGNERLLLGGHYALLRREFTRMPVVASVATLKPQLLVTLGGSDPSCATEQILRALGSLRSVPLHIRCVLGPELAPGRRRNLDGAARVLRDRHIVELISDPPDIVQTFFGASLAITAGGSTCFELAALGIPMLVVVTADNQAAGARVMQERELAIVVGSHPGIDEDALLQPLRRLLTDADARQALTVRARRAVSVHGVRRVVERMVSWPIRLRPVVWTDADQLLEWANDPLTRQMSFSSEPITPEAHGRWLKARLDAQDCRLRIALDGDGKSVGTVRLERSGAAATLSLTLAPTARGRRLAARLIRAAAVESMDDNWCRSVDALVRPDNEASLAAFRRAGFRDLGALADHPYGAHRFECCEQVTTTLLSPRWPEP